jgi:hypothetical protein
MKADELVPTESEEQVTLFELCEMMRFRYPELDMLTHIPNEGKRTKLTGAKLKREGLKRGYPDMVLDVARCGYYGLRIELKRVKDYKISPEQKKWIIKLNEQGYAAVFCFGANHAWKVIESYLSQKKGRVDEEIIKTLAAAKKGVQNG